MRTHRFPPRLLLRGLAACSLLVAGCVDPASTEPLDMPDDSQDGKSDGDEPEEPVATSETIARQVLAQWVEGRVGDPGVMEQVQFRLHGDVIPTAMQSMSWTPTIGVSLRVHKTNYQAGTASHVEVIEPQAATLISRNGDSLTVKIADGTVVEVTSAGFKLSSVASPRSAKLSSLTYWPELMGTASSPHYSLSSIPSYVTQTLPAAVYDTLDTTAVKTGYGFEKNLRIDDAWVFCTRVTATETPSTSCGFQILSPKMSAVNETHVTYLGQAAGPNVSELVEALASTGGVIQGDERSADMTCDDDACRFVWTLPRPDVTMLYGL